MNPFKGELPPGWIAKKAVAAGATLYTIFDEEMRFILATSPDALVPAEATIKYVWAVYKLSLPKQPNHTVRRIKEVTNGK